MGKRYTLLTQRHVIHFRAASINEAKEKGKAIAHMRNVEALFVIEGWTQPAGHIEEGKEIIKVG